jgi:WD40 repeat protein
MATEHDRLAFDATITGQSPTLDDDYLGPGELPALRPVDIQRYQLRGEHGRGGLGVVMRALDRQLGREVAVKLLQDPHPVAAARFLREATITSRLQHPSIVTVLDVVRWIDGSPCYTMPLYPGRSLRSAIDAAHDLRARLAILPKVLAIAEAIAHAHGRGVIHRDIKPSNVLLGTLGEVVVIDWGLAKRVDAPDDPMISGIVEPDVEATRVGQVQGTPAYMAPEQARGEPVDRRADVYSLGALLYHVLAGRTPYDAGSTAEALVLLRDGPPADVTTVVAGVPVDLAAIVRKAMARTPDERYPDAAALAGDLERFLNGRLVEAHAYTPLQLAWRWVVRHRLLLASFVTIIGVLALALQGVRRERQVAVAAARHENLRANAMILTQARTALASDPTAAIAFLATYPEDGADWVTVRSLARNAVRRGIARHILYRQQGYSNEILPIDHGRRALLVDGRLTLVLWDPVSGQKERVCLPAELEGEIRDETFARELVTLLADGRVLVWNADLSASEHVATIPGAVDATLSSDGRTIAVLERSGLVTLVTRATGQAAALAEGVPPLHDVQFVPGTSRLLFVGDDGRAQLYDVDAHRVVYDSAPGVGVSAVSPYGRGVVLVRRGLVEWLDAVTLASRARPASVRDFAPPAFMSDGRVLLTDERSQKTEIWDPVDDKTVTLPLYASAAGASPDGKLVAGFNTSGSVIVVDTTTLGTRELRGHGRHIGRWVQFIGNDTVATLVDGGNARMWDVAPPPAERLAVGKQPYDAPTAVADAAQTLFAAAQDGRVLRRRLEGGAAEPIFRAPARVLQLAVTPDGQTVLVATVAGELWRWQAPAAAPELLFRDVPVLARLAIARDGQHALGLSGHEEIGVVWDLAARTRRAFDHMNGYCESVALSGDDRLGAFSCSLDARSGVTVVDLEHDGAARVLVSPYAFTYMIGFSPSGRYLYALARAGRLLRWDVATGALATREVHNAEADGGQVLDEDLVYSTGADGLVLTLFSLGVSHLVDATADVRGFVLSPDHRLASGRTGSDENGILLWELASGESWSVPRYAGIREVSFGRDGQVVAAGKDGAVRLFARPATLAAPPAETRAWLGSLTSVRLGDELAPRPACE